MRVTASVTIVVLSCISAGVAGLVLRPTDSVVKEPMNLRYVATEYVTELTAQNEAINRIGHQISLGSERSTEKFSEFCNELLESYYRQTDPRNRMVEITPTDSVLDSTSIEYIVAVASRYATNVMHLARKLRDDPFDEEFVLEDMNNLRREHTKTQLFDQILLELLNVSLNDEIIAPSEDIDISKTEDLATHKAIQPQTGKEGEENVDVIVKVEQEIHTTTTETVVTSYTVSSASA